MTTPQKSYRDLVEGETIKETDTCFNSQDKTWGPPEMAVGMKLSLTHIPFRRPIHRQPDGSWRDEGDGLKKWTVSQLTFVIRDELRTSGFNVENPMVTDELSKSLASRLCIPLEPEQEEWEKAFDSRGPREGYGTQDEWEKDKLAFKQGWQAHERKQGGME